MRARRPELFSDSETVQESALSPEVFEFLLDQLTTNKKELDFEHFCRRLAEAELCPNLVPQTGPTGGGDSKADAENYPVSERISMRWYTGEPSIYGQERWAFAFSAKKDWRPKVRSDVRGLVETGRNYALIYFLTNQPVKDRTRTEAEAELTASFGVPVRILDRIWISKCIFEHNRQELAIETLHISASLKPLRQVGPKDLRTERELKELEKGIDDPARYTGVEYQLIEDCLEAAILARNLERPRVEVIGRFQRASALAARFGSPNQQLRIAYQQAWTAFWWYEDYEEFLAKFEEVIPLASRSSFSEDLGQAVNLWFLLHGACLNARLDPIVAKSENKRTLLYEALQEVQTDRERPSHALWADAQKTFLDLVHKQGDESATRENIEKLNIIVQTSDGLLSLPLDALAQIVEQLGELFASLPEYDGLIESAARIMQERFGKREAGRVLLARGFQKFRAAQIYDAIRFFGRAQQMLAIREAHSELREALFVGGLAYESAGLLWAARANVLAVADLILAETRTSGELPPNLLFVRQAHGLVGDPIGENSPCAPVGEPH